MDEGTWELTPEDELFPSTLKDNPHAEVERLYGRGDPAALSQRSVAVIGARRATPYGIAIARMAGRIAGESGIMVVSGGAMGCDHAASRAALDAGGKTVIVSGCGIDRIYPRTSEDIFRETVARGGAVVTLEPAGTPPLPYNFPKRNVIIASLCEALLVTEAGDRSGTMSTADAALEMDKTIYAVPGSIFSPTSQATNRLICEGAHPICSEADLETRLTLDFGVVRIVAEGVPRDLGEVLSALLAMPARPDELATRLGVPTLGLLQDLTEYETRGLVERLPDGRYSLTADAYEHAGREA